ncbi:response regulator [Amycolatopsis rhabdoformis]|uniref:Response regulator n=1 Tax=Amycolatopsis rhabdoformis TaxID=1448059 RepID=A0ABZ1IDY2_9PSEU|nr:response regulator [Amycolatopsis rhabdoformis]WSE32132.1 response regulator [Amycolatopsis rhabdoformis]
MLRASLAQEGYDVVWRTRGEEALVEAERQAPDLVLLDLGLPDLDGIRLCRRMRDARPDSVIVILPARSEAIDVVVGRLRWLWAGFSSTPSRDASLWTVAKCRCGPKSSSSCCAWPRMPAPRSVARR